VLVLALSGCSGDGPAVVQSAAVVRADVAEMVDAPGQVTARAVASVTSPTDASVSEVLVKDGAQVAKDAVLARLSSPSAQERLRQALNAQAQARQAGAVRIPRADLGPVQDNLDAAAAQSFATGRAAAALVPDPAQRARANEQVAQAERQYAASSTAARRALAQLDAGANGIESAIAAVSSGQRAQAASAVQLARATVDALVVRAPIAGTVTLGAGGVAPPAGGSGLSGLIAGLPPAVQGQASAALGASGGKSSGATATEGLVVGTQLASGTPLLTVTDLGGLSVTAEVDETDVLQVKAGTTAVIEIGAVPDARYTATVRAVDLSPTSSAGGGVTYRVRLELGAGTLVGDAPAPTPRPGMSAVVNLQVRTAKAVVTVPSAAVVRDGGRDAVFVVEAGKVIRREVRLGAQGQELVEVVRGLDPGVRVVVRDADRLTDGQAVQS